MDVSLAADSGHGHGEVCRTPLPLINLHMRLHIREQSPQGAFHPEQVRHLAGRASPWSGVVRPNIGYACGAATGQSFAAMASKSSKLTAGASSKKRTNQVCILAVRRGDTGDVNTDRKSSSRSYTASPK